MCYTDDQDRRCLECLINAPKRQRLIANLETRLLRAEQIIVNDSLVYQEKVREIKEKDAEIQELTKSVRRQRRQKWVFGSVGLAVIGFLIFR